MLNPILTPELRKKILTRQREVYKTFSKVFDFPVDGYGGCVFHALAGVEAGRNHGMVLTPVAGSASFLMNRQGGMLEYIWNPEGFAKAKSLGVLPECHVWLQHVHPTFEVDFSIEFLSKGPVPTDRKFPESFWWSEPESMKLVGFEYVPNKEATAYIWERMTRLKMILNLK